MIGAIVLAAGASTRMGRPKATLTVGTNGPTFVEAILTTLTSAGVDAVRVVVAPGGPFAGERAIVNPDPMRGMLSSVQCGLMAIGADLHAVLLWPVDHPLVKTSTVQEIVAAFRTTGAPVVVPVHRGKRGHPVLFASGVFPELLAADPSVGARGVVHAHDDRVELPVPDSGVVADMNTPEDYGKRFGARMPSR